MKLSKKQMIDLKGMLGDLRRAEKFLMSDQTILARKCTIKAMPEDTYINQGTGEPALIFNKNMGSDLCYFSNALNKLNNFINSEA